MSVDTGDHEVALYVGPDALRIDVWDQYTFDLSILETGAAFTLSFWYSDEALASWQRLTDRERGAKCGQIVTATIDGEAVLSGIIETRKVGDSAEGRAPPVFVISGRDLLGPASSWDADPALALRGLPLDEALARLYAPLGIVAEVSEHVDPDTRVGTLRRPRRPKRARRVSRAQQLAVTHPKIGEKVQAVVERIVRGAGLRVWTTVAEDATRTPVVVDRPASSGPARFTLLRELEGGRVTDRSNLRWGAESTSIREAPTRVTVFSQGSRGDKASDAFARAVENGYLLTEEALARIDTNTPERPRYVHSDQARTPEAALQEGAKILAEANESLRSYEGAVLGHRQDGRLWYPNALCAVRDQIAGVDETMLITRVSLSGGRAQGPKTRLSLLPLGALSEIPVPA